MTGNAHPFRDPAHSLRVAAFALGRGRTPGAVHARARPTHKEMPVILSKSAFVVALSITAIAGSAPAWADTSSPVFDAFAKVCAVPAADFTSVKAAADAERWGPSDAQADASMAGVTVADTLTRGSTIGKTGVVLSAWHGTTKTGVKIGDCTMHVQKADFALIKGAAGTWLAFPAQEDSPKRAIYRFTETAGAHHPLTPAEFDAAAAATGLEILTVSGDASGTVLDLMVIKK